MTKALILYCDGSARPNPGFAGWGVHGYYCELVAPKKGTGHKTHILTDRGYRAKLDATAKKHEVTPLEYIDATGSLPYSNTNNTAEIKAAIEAIKLGLARDVEKVAIYSDSKMVVEALSSWIAQWKRNGWVKRDGSPLSNVLLWKELDEMRSAIVAKGVDFKIEWVRGHATDPGNHIADKLAVVGTIRSSRHDAKTQVDIKPADGYWKIEVDKNPLLDFSGLFFNTLEGYNEPGLYYLCNKNKEEDIIEAILSDKAYGIVKLKEPDVAIEFIRNYQSKVSGNGKRDLLVMARLDQIFKPEIYQDLIDYGEGVINLQGKYQDLHHATLNEPITRVLIPPKLAMQAVEYLSHLATKLEEFEKSEGENTITEITDLFYEEVETKKKGGGLEKRLKAEFNVGFSKLPIKVNYGVDGKLGQSDLILSFGSDIIGRNALKRIETQDPRIFILTWMESDLMFRYATVIRTQNDISIWSSVRSNLKLLKG